jgi:hypothetical protein
MKESALYMSLVFWKDFKFRGYVSRGCQPSAGERTSHLRKQKLQKLLLPWMIYLQRLGSRVAPCTIVYQSFSEAVGSRLGQ